MTDMMPMISGAWADAYPVPSPASVPLSHGTLHDAYNAMTVMLLMNVGVWVGAYVTIAKLEQGNGYLPFGTR